jgi:hypothetical protein
MKLHYKLNLKLSPLKDNFQFPQPRLDYYIMEPDILSEEILIYFKSLGLDVSMCILFSRMPFNSNPNQKNQGIIHSDVTWNGTSWESLYYAINYELTDSASTLSWWDVPDTPIYPETPVKVQHSDRLRGIHYGKRNNLNPVISNYKLLDSVRIPKDQPVLVNTQIPHSVDYFGQATQRWGLSIRFEQKVQNWQQGIEYFKKDISENNE